MSDLLFPHSGLSRTRLRLRLLAVGGVATLALAVVAAGLGLSFLGVLTGDVRAEARLVSTGDSLGVGSDVKFRGLRVGRVLEVQAGEEPAARIVLMAEHAEQIPADVRARVLPGTLFGNEYVELVTAGDRASDPASDPASAGATGAAPTAERLSDGAVIPADTSARTLRLMDTFTATQGLLAAIDPAQVDAAVSQLARALDGRGDDLGRLLEDADRLLGTWARNEPAFLRNLDLLARNVDTLAEVEPNLVRAVRDSLPVARTLAEKERATTALMRGGTALMVEVGGFLGDSADLLARTLRGTADTLAVFAVRHPDFELLVGKLPAVLVNGAEAVSDTAIQMNAAIGSGLPDPYTAADCPRYGDLAGRNCPTATSGGDAR
ncbi:MCE family protein [Nocardioides ferulae]|uniref:MCE family protein n=1 Tax=Nocardioides ferulae TaxID=2340821 RepID=UPI000EB4A5CE|nr:MCE family protein [Nocardioides ferulae]